MKGKKIKLLVMVLNLTRILYTYSWTVTDKIWCKVGTVV